MCRKAANVDALMAELAARQHGVVSLTQLSRLGVEEASVHRRAKAGRLHRVHRGVYAVGHFALSPQARWLAAVLALGEGAVLSHSSAAALWGLIRPLGHEVHVTVPSTGGRNRRQGIRLHRTTTLSSACVTVREGIPVTTPARTLEDISGSLPERLVRRAIRQAELAGFDLGPSPEADRTRSELESMFLALCRRHRLPRPEVNATLDGLTVDFLWREPRLVVETDGYRFHSGRVAFEDDRARDLRLKALGLDVIRLSYRQVAGEGDRVASVLRKAIAARRHEHGHLAS